MLKIYQRKGTLGTQRFLTHFYRKSWSLIAVMMITSIEEFNLQGFQGDQISYRHGNGKPTNLSLGKYSKLLAVTFYIYLYVKWALLSGCSVQTALHSLFPVLRCQILDAITPVCILEVRGNSDRKSQWKQTQKWVVFVGKKIIIIWQTHAVPRQFHTLLFRIPGSLYHVLWNCSWMSFVQFELPNLVQMS